MASKVLSRWPAGGAILDVGTGDGSFLKRLGPAWTRHATEGSDTTRERLRREGIRCFGSTTDAVAEAAGTFQAVTMFQVLEHVAAFDDLLADCRSLLRPGGVIAISVPLAQAMFDQERLTGCQDMIPNHINKWSPEALAVVLRRAGFEPEPAIVEPGSVREGLYRASLMTRAQAASSPGSLASRAYGIRSRPARIAVLAALSGGNLLASLPSLPALMTGSSFLMIGHKPAPTG